MSNEGPRASTGITKERARTGLSRLQALTGILLLASALSGVYLLYTDGSLWLLAVSHAVGLIMIVAIDAVLGIMNLASSRRVYLPTIAAAVLAIVLQLGDIATAPQYNMTVSYFASYLFGLWAFDLLLGLQAAILVLGVVGRPYAVYLARRKSRRGRELDYTRRGFLRSVVALAGLVGVGVVLGSVKLPTPANTTTVTQTQSGLPSGAIANINAMKPSTPVYFDYPTGYPNILMMKADGSLAALSILCTHVCCGCEYVQSGSVIACPCHGSVFDLSGNVVRGPANVPLPSISLRTDGSGNVFPTGVSSAGPCHA